MEQFDREDSSTYVNNRPGRLDEPTEPTPAPVAPTPQPEPKRKKSKAPLVLTLLLLLALVAAGVFGWLWYQQNGEVDSVRSDLSTARNKISQLESAAKAEAALEDDASDVVTDTKDDDSEAIIKAVSAYARGAAGASNQNITAEIKTTKDSFASATYANASVTASGGGLCILKKSEEVWLVLYCAQADSEYTMQLDKQFGVPSGLK